MEQPQQFYQAGNAGAEAEIAERLARWKELKGRMQAEE